MSQNVKSGFGEKALILKKGQKRITGEFYKTLRTLMLTAHRRSRNLPRLGSSWEGTLVPLSVPLSGQVHSLILLIRSLLSHAWGFVAAMWSLLGSVLLCLKCMLEFDFQS